MPREDNETTPEVPFRSDPNSSLSSCGYLPRFRALVPCFPISSVSSHTKCVRHGHELVCLANLYPPVAVSDEADSFMYQSAAHTAIEAQAECFGKPLIRR